MTGGRGASYADLAALVAARPPRAGGTRVVAVDGFSGSGKTTLAARLAALLDAPVVAVEDVVPGWDGLAAGVAVVSSGLLEPLARGEPGRLATWDWVAGRPGPVVEVAPGPLLLLEGCGAVAVPARGLLSAGLWVDLPAAERERRLRARADWPLHAPHRARWAAQEEALAAGGGGPAAADLVVRVGADGVELLPAPPRG